MDIRFDGKTIVVIGGSTGIGEATVKMFAQSGGKVIFTGIESEGKIDVHGYHQEADPAPVYKQLDIRNEEDVRKFAESVGKEFKGCDVLFNNAGIIIPHALHETTTEEWQKTLDVNLTGMFFTSKYFLPQMMNKGGGAIVNTSSISGLFADYVFCSYNASKGAVANLTRNMALDYAKYNIRVNAVAPGTIKTPMFYSGVDAFGGPELLEYCASRPYPGYRVGRPEEIAAAVLFLASDQASFISGINLVVDGAITAHTGQQRDYATAKFLFSASANNNKK